MNYKAIISTILATSILGGCALVYKPDIQQGNIIRTADVHKLRRNMTTISVMDLFGSPVDTQSFRNNMTTYVYSLKPRHGHKVNKHLIIRFRNNRVISWSQNQF